MNFRSFAATVFLIFAGASAGACLRAQAISGDLVGLVRDSSGAYIAGAEVEAVETATNLQSRARTNTGGEYRLANLPPGAWDLSVSAPGFAASSVKGVTVDADKIASVEITLLPGPLSTSVNVTDAAPAIDTTTSTIGSAFDSRQARDLPISSVGLGVLNLALLTAGVAGNGGLNAGSGPSVGGQRPRNNNFMIEGIDNNYKSQTGAILTVPNDATAELTIMQNMFGAEFGHSSGGQFNVILRSGANAFHGTLYEYFENRNLNATDPQFAANGIQGKPRFDQNRVGASLGGPLIHDKLFFFGDYEYNPLGQSTTPGEILSPTAKGFATLASLPGLSAANLSVLKRYVPPAPSALTDATQYPLVAGVPVEVGQTAVSAPNYQNGYAGVASLDYNPSGTNQIRLRYVYNHLDTIDHSAQLPVFFQNQPSTYHLATLAAYHSFTPSLTGELRLGFTRLSTNTPAGNYQFPGLDSFPNIVIGDLNGLQLGPDQFSPQSAAQNSYQLNGNIVWTRQRHTVRAGAEVRRVIAPTSFVQRERGDYEYGTLDLFLRDITPDDFAYRAVGNPVYYGNDWSFYGYASDAWRLRPNLTVNLGVRYEFTSVPLSDGLQALNAVSNVPGLLTFSAPQAQKKNFAPRIGIAWSPGTSGATSIRAGFGMAYDVIYDNIGVNSLPPQFVTAVDVTGAGAGNFLARGGILPSAPAGALSAADARAATGAYIPDQKMPYSLQWTAGIQHVFARNYTLEARYLGTRGVHLNVQTRPFDISPVTSTAFLPTYLAAPTQATLDALPLTLSQLQQKPTIVPAIAAAGFTNGSFTEDSPIGNSSYHGLAMQLNRRWSDGLTLSGAYTWSHLIDDSTADFFTTLLTPRRPQDFQNMRAERSSSALDHRQRLALSAIYELPLPRSSNAFLRYVAANWSLASVYIYESPEFVTVLSQTDANLNHDFFTDRAIVNPAGTDGVGTSVTPLRNSAGDVVAYLAANPNARYIQAGPGAFATGGRNTLPGRPIDNVDFSLIKNIRLRERSSLQFSAQFFNFFNHPQFVPGFVNRVDNPVVPNTSGAVFNYQTPGSPLFNRPEQVFSGNPRITQLALKLIF